MTGALLMPMTSVTIVSFHSQLFSSRSHAVHEILPPVASIPPQLRRIAPQSCRPDRSVQPRGFVRLSCQGAELLASSVERGQLLHAPTSEHPSRSLGRSSFFRRSLIFSVGLVGTTNEGCAPGESQDSSGEHARNKHGRRSISEASSPSLCSKASRATGSSPDPKPDIARQRLACAPPPLASERGQGA